MLIHIEQRDKCEYKDQLSQYFSLRKRVFHDQLNWDVEVEGNTETDCLDDEPCTYTLYIDDVGTVLAGARLIPTTQMTLLERSFSGLVPEEMSFNSPTIWEVSRYCVDHKISDSRMPSGAKKATLALSIGNYDYARQNGIEFYIGVVEGRMFEFCKNYNFGAEILGEEVIDGNRVICALYPINEQVGQVAENIRKLIF